MYPPFLNVCFAIKWVDAGLLCERLDQKWLIKVGYGKTDHHGKFIRMICVDPDMNQSDIDYFFQELLDEANKL
jgi:ribulose bisphosphate carboxylase small subunit